MRTHTHRQTRVLLHKHTHTHTCRHMRAHTQTSMLSHKHTHTHRHMRTHTHISYLWCCMTSADLCLHVWEDSGTLSDFSSTSNSLSEDGCNPLWAVKACVVVAGFKSSQQLQTICSCLPGSICPSGSLVNSTPLILSVKTLGKSGAFSLAKNEP